MNPFDPNDPDFQKAMRQADLAGEYWNSPELVVVTRARTFDITIKIFERNYEELKAEIERQQPRTREDIMRWAMDARFRQDQLDEITRLLHNFVASASSLIDHARVFFREVYEPGNQMPDYQGKVDASFKTDALAQFIVGLRQYCQHYRSPILSGTRSVNNVRNEISGGAHLEKEMLLRFGGWNSHAKRFIDEAPEKIDLTDICDQYHTNVSTFYDWFKAEQARIHKDAFDYVARVEQELNTP